MADNSFARSPLDIQLAANKARNAELRAGLGRTEQAAPQAPASMRDIAIRSQIPTNLLDAVAEAAGVSDLAQMDAFASNLAKHVKGGASIEDAMQAMFPDADVNPILDRASAMAQPQKTAEPEAPEQPAEEEYSGKSGLTQALSAVTAGASRALGSSVDEAGERLSQAANGEMRGPQFSSDFEIGEDGVLRPVKGSGKLEERPEIEEAGVFRAIGDKIAGGLRGFADKIIDRNVSEDVRKEMQSSGLDGSVLDPANIKLKEGTTVRGLAMNGLDAMGSLVPILIAGATTGGVGSLAVGGTMSGGSARETSDQIIDEAFAKKGEDGRSILETESPLFQRLKASGMDDAEAVELVKRRAGNLASAFAAPIGALGGVATNAIASKGVGALAGKNIAVRTVGGAVISALEEGTQEAAESIAGKTGTKQVTGLNIDVGEGTANDFLLGAISGAPVGAIGGIRGEGQGDATPTEPERLGLPAPDPVAPAAPEAAAPVEEPAPMAEAAPVPPVAPDAPQTFDNIADTFAPAPERPALGPLARAAAAAPVQAPAAPAILPADLPDAAALDIMIPGVSRPVRGEFIAESPNGITVKINGQKQMIPRAEIEAGEVSITPTNLVREAGEAMLSEEREVKFGPEVIDEPQKVEVSEPAIQVGASITVEDHPTSTKSAVLKGLSKEDEAKLEGMKYRAKWNEKLGGYLISKKQAPKILEGLNTGGVSENAGMSQAEIAAELERVGVKSPAELQKKPFTSVMKGIEFGRTINGQTQNVRGIDPSSPAAQDLYAAGVDPKSSPGLFRKGGATDLDTIPVSEMREMFPDAPDDGNGYVDRQWIIDGLAEEMGGKPRFTAEQQEAAAQKAQYDELVEAMERGQYDLEAQQAAAEPQRPWSIPAREEDISTDGERMSDISDAMAVYGDALTADERRLIEDDLFANGGVPEYAIQAFLNRADGYDGYSNEAKESIEYEPVKFGPPADEIPFPFAGTETFNATEPRQADAGKPDGGAKGSSKPEGNAAGSGAGRGGNRTSQAGPRKSETTDAGEQTLIDGVEPVTDKAKAEVQMNKPKRGGDAAADFGLFDANARNQQDMFDAPKTQQAAFTPAEYDQHEGENSKGEPVYTEEDGLRYVVRGGKKVQEDFEPHPLNPDVRSPKPDSRNSGSDFLTVAEDEIVRSVDEAKAKKANAARPNLDALADIGMERGDGGAYTERLMSADGAIEHTYKATPTYNDKTGSWGVRVVRLNNVKRSGVFGDVGGVPTTNIGTFKSGEQAAEAIRQDKAVTIGEPEAPKAKAAPEKSAGTGILGSLSQEKQDRAAELKKRLAAKARTQMSSGLDPEYITLGGELVALYIEAGTRKFGAMLKDFAETTGLTMREAQEPMRAAYGHVRDNMDLNGEDISGMDDHAAVMAEVRRAIAEEANAGQENQTVEKKPETADIKEAPANEDSTDGTDGLVQGRERETSGDAAEGQRLGAPDDQALAGEQPEDGGADAEGERPVGSGTRSDEQDAGRQDDVSEIGDGADRRTGTGGTGVATDGARSRPAKPPARNYVISDPEAIVGGTPMVRFRRNQAAIEALNDIVAEGRNPTKEELDAMAGYTGWGSFGQELFQGSWENPRPKEGWADRDAWLRDHLGKEGWKSAQASIINAHYTDPPTVQAMWAMVEKMGFKGGRVLEPSMGIGNFFGLMPQHLAQHSNLFGIELDQTTGGMAQLLYPDATIAIKGYEKSQTPDNFYDLVIGNWPFAKDGPADRRYGKLKPSLHDYFFVKGLDQVRPGGLVVGITSAGTMDKMGKAVRDHLARNAELVTAIRLPSGAFEKYAGTKVVTDIVVLKKRETPAISTADSGWLNAVEVPTPAGTDIRVNEFFRDHPENVLGTLNFGSGTTYGRAAMIVDRPADLMDRLAALPDKVIEGTYEPITRGQEERFITNNTSDRVGSVVSHEGELMVVRGEHLAPLSDSVKWELKDKKKTAARKDALTRLADIRKRYGATIDAERAGDGTAETKRKALKKAYDAFRKAHGPIVGSDAIRILDRANDPNAPMLEALERTDGTPSDVLTKPLTRSVTKIDNPTVADAFVMARNESTTLNLDRVAELAKRPVEDVAAELLDKGAIYQMPGGTYEISDLFLSGNVRKRLRALEEAQEQGEDLTASIEAIKKVVPEDIPYYKIAANLGAVWMGTDTVRDFAADLLGLSPDQAGGIKVSFVGGTWRAKFVDRNLMYRPEATTQHGTAHTKFDKIFNAALNNTPLKVTSTDEHGNKFVDKEKSKEASEKATKIRERFEEWVWAEPERRVDLAEKYNESMNAIAEPSFDGSFLEFPGMALQRGSSPFNLRKHQSDAIWRGIVKGRGLYAHEVGTGKTYTMGGIAVESCRFGLAKKPMIVAHNANSATVAREINDMYPGAKVLYVSNLSPATIKRTLYSIRNDDWDAVVIPHSLLDRMTLSEDTLRAMTEEEIAALETAALEAAEEDDAALSLADMDDDEAMKKVRSVTAKELVKMRNRIKASVEKQIIAATREDAIVFEDLGVDMLLVDEGHEFKKPPFVTKMRMKGLQTSTSNRAMQMQFLTRYVRQINGGRGVHVFTGTPITNTLTEMFHQMRYVMEDVMNDNSVGDWDGWFNTFAAAEDDLEIASDGQFETVTRLSSFVNVAELRRMAGEFLDTVFADDMPEFVPRTTESGKTMADELTKDEREQLINGRSESPIGRPYKKVVNETAPMNPAQRAVQEDLARRYDKFRQSEGKERMKIIRAKAGTEDSKYNPLLISLEADAAAFDIRLRDPSREDHPESKVNRAVSNVMKHYREHDLATQVIFMDKGFENFGTEAGEKVARLNVAADIRDKLVANGVPAEQIAIVTGKTSKEKRRELADKMNTGEIRVIIGGTQTLGVGVNMQLNLRAMHHLDAPWMPGELEQRNGRGHRQGNHWNTVLEYRYMTERLDAKRWQTLAKKQRFITDFMKADANTRIIDGDAADTSESTSGDDITESLSDAAGDPRIMQLSKLNMQVEKLQRRQTTHDRGAVDAGRRAERLTKEVVRLKKSVEAMKADAGHVAAVREAETFTGTIKGKTFTDRAEFTEALAVIEAGEISLKNTRGAWEPLGVSVNGFEVEYERYGDQSTPAYQIRRTDAYPVGKMSLASFENRMRRLANEASELDGMIADKLESAERLKKAAKEPFAQAEALASKRKQAANLESDMEANPEPAPAWLRQGAPMDTKIVYDGQTRVVIGHRANEGRFFVLTEEGAVPYLDVKSEDGMDVYDPVEGDTRKPKPQEKAPEPKSFEEMQMEDDGGPAWKESRQRKTRPEAPKKLTAELQSLTDRMNAEIERYGLKGKITVKALKGIKAGPISLDGFYMEGVIGVSAASDEGPMETFAHEIIHALRDSHIWGTDYGLFTKAEWQALVRQARRMKDIQEDIDAEYSDLDTAAKMEEVIAEMYARWKSGADVGTETASLLQRISDAFNAIVAALRGEGFHTAAEVFAKIEAGQIGRRSQDGGPDGTPPTGGGKMKARRKKGQTGPFPANTRIKAKDERGYMGNLMSMAMQGKGNASLLNATPGRALLSELGKKMPSLTTYLRLKERMDARRNSLHSELDKVAQEWRKLLKNEKANKAMMDLMTDTTIAQIDPSLPFQPKAEPSDTRIINEKSPRSVAYQMAQERLAEDVDRRIEYDALKARFDALPSEYQAMYRKVRDAYSTQADAFEKAVMDNAEKAMKLSIRRAERAHKKRLREIADDGLTGLEREAAIQEADEKLALAKRTSGWSRSARLQQLRAAFESNRLGGPYFPLKRYGDYFVTARNEEGAVVSFSRFESEKEQMQEVRALRREGLEAEYGVLNDTDGAREAVDPTFVADVETLLEGFDAADELKDMIWQRWLESLPDMSTRKNRIHRKGRAGYDRDAFRAFGHTMFHGAHQLARLEYGMDMGEALDVAGEEAKDADDPNRAGMVLNEVKRRHKFTMNPKGSVISTFATASAFIYYLAISPAAAVVNLSQTSVVAPAILGAYRGVGVGAASVELSKALVDFTRGKGQAQKSKRLSQAEHRALHQAYERGVIDKSQAHDLAGVGESGVAYNATHQRVMGAISYFFHHTERMNREVTFLAAYRLAIKKGEGHDQAVETAGDLTWKTHFDYQNNSRPRLMQNDWMKVLLTFRNFQVNMLYRLFRDIHQTFNGEDAETRKEARTQLIGITASMMLHAGVKGTWGYALIMFLLGMFFGGDDDDLEPELEQAVFNLLGREAGSMLLNGVPGALTDTNLTSRMGMPDLWFRSSDRVLEGDDAYNYWVAELIGPVPAIGENLFRGASMMKDGNYWRGAETMAPKAVRDLSKAIRYGTDGVTTMKGDAIVENVSWGELFKQAIGFTPARISEQYERNTRMKNDQQRIADEKSKILQKAGSEVMEGGQVSQDSLDAMAEFTKKYGIPLGAKELRASIKGRVRASAQNRGGIVLPKSYENYILSKQPPKFYDKE